MGRVDEGSIKGHCNFGESIERAVGGKLRAGYHVADLDDLVCVAGPPPASGESLDLYVAKLIAGSLSDGQLEALAQECRRLAEESRW